MKVDGLVKERAKNKNDRDNKVLNVNNLFCLFSKK